MYSVVLMMALSGNGDLPACHFCKKPKCEEPPPACAEPAPCPPAAEPAPAPKPPTKIEEKPTKEPEKVKEPEMKKEASLPTRSTLVVSLPADATLIVQGKQTVTEGNRRTFVTPDLIPGTVCAYTLTAEVVVEGKKVSQSRTVSFRAGETVNLQLDFPQASIAAR